jgi:hypothetical protein
MSNEAAKEFKSYLEEKEVLCNFIDEEENVVRVGWTLKDTELELYFAFGEENYDVHIQGCDFLRVPESRFDKMLAAVNTCNEKYRWVKFTLDRESRQIIAEYDALIRSDIWPDDLFEIMMCMSHIIDAAYPKLMKAIWS